MDSTTMRGMILMLLIAMGIVLAGCESSIDLELPIDGVLQLTIISGTTMSNCSIAANSDGIKTIATWLDALQDGWEPSPASYVLDIELKGDGFSIQFSNGFAVVNYEEGQFTHSVPAGVFTELHCPDEP